VLVQLEADVAVILAVVVVGRVADVRAPHQLGRHRVPGERRHAGRAIHGGADAELRPRLGVIEGVRIDEEVTDARLGEDVVQAGIEGAFRHPHALGRAAKMRSCSCTAVKTWARTVAGSELSMAGSRACRRR